MNPNEIERLRKHLLENIRVVIGNIRDEIAHVQMQAEGGLESALNGVNAAAEDLDRLEKVSAPGYKLSAEDRHELSLAEAAEVDAEFERKTYPATEPPEHSTSKPN
jgi:hypothetical protein